MPKVSVLVAVYNAESWLPRCLDSLRAQTLNDIQVICVDDASTDRSLAVLNDYASRDERFEVVAMKNNVGIAKARNMALDRAKGEYVCMLDADDWYGEDALEQAVEVFEQYSQTDVVLFQFMLVWPDHEQLYPSQSFSVLDGRAACQLSIDWQIHGIYMVRSSIHKNYPYDDTCRLFSDENTTRLHYAVAREVRYCTGVYYYRQHVQSMTHRPSVLQFDKLKAKESLIDSLRDLKFNVNQLTNMLWLDLVDLYMFYHVHGVELTEEERGYGLKELRRVWSTIDRKVLNKKTITKFGYRPCHSWFSFRLQEWAYFTLRGWLGKNH